jgi:hypothetical protein
LPRLTQAPSQLHRVGTAGIDGETTWGDSPPVCSARTPPRNLAWDAVQASGTRLRWSMVRMDGAVGTLQAYGAGGKSQFLVGVLHRLKSALHRGQGV